VQLGFVIDHGRCIGCHACTVACKAENDVPLGSFRTWVKYTERGSFPDVRRSFAVLRCNQCSDAPCVTICPVHALAKRPDGIVDIDPERCIGCKSCLQGCPYDAIYINEDRGIAQKCHFCAHRTEQGLAPACAIVCPTEAIVPGDFDDPASTVSRMRAADSLQVRKPEAGTRPNVFYREVTRDAIDPMRANSASGYLWSDRLPGVQLDAQEFEALERRAEARSVYDVAHPPAWGARVSGYLFTKSIAAGAFLAGAVAAAGTVAGAGALWIGGLALAFLALTTVLLVADLKRPERFLYVLRHANWDSWLSRGAVILMAYGALATAWLAVEGTGIALPAAARSLLVGVTGVAAALTAAYTAWLFGQSRGRVLWLRRTLALELLVHAFVAGGAALLVLGLPLGLGEAFVDRMRLVLGCALAAQLAMVAIEGRFGPAARAEEFRRAHRLVSHGPFATRRWWVGVGAGTVLPLVLVASPLPEPLWVLAGLLALVGLWTEQDILVRAGQAPAIS
jgi:Fe-S-cluster-containing dehydrogenase component/formate-dependent nitrite reductase membrane component NrfD